MSKTTTTIQINHDGNGKVTFTQNGRTPGVLEISDDVNLEIQLGTGFTGNSAEVAISAKGNNILVNDTNTTGTDDCFFFSVTATDGNRDYSSDPELRVKKKLGNR